MAAVSTRKVEDTLRRQTWHETCTPDCRWTVRMRSRRLELKRQMETGGLIVAGNRCRWVRQNRGAEADYGKVLGK